MHSILLTKQAEKDYAYLYKANRAIFNRVKAALYSLAQDPHQGKPLKLTLKGLWSYRIGMYRVLYRIENKKLVVIVLEIGHRREIYRQRY